MRTLSKLASTAALALATTLVLSCSSDDSSDNNSSGGGSLSGNTTADNNIYTVKAGYANRTGYWNGDSDGLEKWNGNGKFIMHIRCGDNIKIEAGEVANGKLSLNLPSETEIPESCSKGLVIDGVSVSPPDFKLAELDEDAFIVGNDGKCYSLNYAITTDTWKVNMLYWHFYKAATISGTPTIDGYTFNVNAPKGWNKLYLIQYENGNRLATTDNSILEIEPVWHIMKDVNCEDDSFF